MPKELTYQHYLEWVTVARLEVAPDPYNPQTQVWPSWDGQVNFKKTQDEQLLENYEKWLQYGEDANLAFFLPQYFKSLPSTEEMVVTIFGEDYL